MSYLKEFQEQLDRNDFRKFFQLWEEYCTNDTVDEVELIALLKAIKASELAKTFGQYVETALPLWQLIKDEKAAYEVLRLIIDLQTTNSTMLADITLKAIEARHASHPDHQKRLRLVGMRTKENFQGAITSYELLAHMEKGKFLYHAGGWGTGEIVEVSPVREEVLIEFENIMGRKTLSFANAFKALTPIQNDHFLARRFSDPDALEEEAKRQPLETLKLLLRDLGPKTASEIKDELCDLVIPEADWPKWWQAVRARLKKDTMIEAPESLRQPFILRRSAVSHEELFKKELGNKKNLAEILVTTYNFVRDLPDMLKKPEVKKSLQEQLTALLTEEELTLAQKLQVHIFLEAHFNQKVDGKTVGEVLKDIEPAELDELINSIEILAFKKRALVAIKEHREDWADLFVNFLYTLQQNPLRDFVLKELQDKEPAKLQEKLQDLIIHPTKQPEAFVWFFQKVVSEKDVPFSDKKGQCECLETFLILFSVLENQPEHRDLIKKMYTILSGKRFLVVRQIIEATSIEFINEFLLLVSKCRTLNDHDKKILRSLAEVVHPSLIQKGKKIDHHILWTTEDGYLRTQSRIKHLGTVEIVENAREIEAARALGDLRENSEYKFALERRSRLQTELKTLSDQLNRARIITKDDISIREVGVGTQVELKDPHGKASSYTILGPWEADPDKNILSFQSKLAESMLGKKEGEKVEFRDDTFTIGKIRSFLS